MLAERLSNLPRHRLPLIGRDQELAAVRRTLLQAPGGLLTLTGAGGCGKTSLALQVAEDLVDEFPDGIWLVELGPLSDPARVSQVVASTLGVQEAPNRSLLDSVIAFLRPKALLLVLDNCEHLVDACAALTDQLLSVCPELRILATSREPLHTPGEVTWRVPSLGTPDPGRLPPPAELTDFPAVRLFAERARAVEPGFALTAENASSVAQVCARLGGMPLALELAAARVRVLPVEQLVARLDDSFRLLRGGSRTAPSRHQTLKATLDWSYALLSDAERALLRRLAAFPRRFDLEAAEAVCAGPGVEVSDVLDLLARLVDKSLVVAEGHAGEASYHLLEPVRQYAQDRLAESGEAEAAGRRHATYYLDVAERAEPELRRQRQATWLARLEREHDNMRAALHWADSRNEAEMLLRLSGALAYFWFNYGHITEGWHWLDAALAMGNGAPARARAKALCGAAHLALGRSDYVRAATLAEEAIALWQQLHENWWVAWALIVRGLSSAQLGNLEAGLRDQERSAALFGELGDPWGAGVAIGHQGVVARLQGERRTARSRLEQGLSLLREAGTGASTTVLLSEAAFLAQEEGDERRVAQLTAESLALLRSGALRWYLPEALELMAGVASAHARPGRAARLFGAAEALREVTGVPLARRNRASYERHLAAARGGLDQADFALAWTEGRRMPPEEAIEYALATEEAGPPSALAAPAAAAQHLDVLSPREREVAALVARGLSSRQIAARLVIAEGTARVHVDHILTKLDLHSRAQLASWAVEHGLIGPRSD